ncbi:MAG: response regulator, partial [bacterium]
TGVGMDKKTQSRLFDPLFTTKEVGKGTGLGLAVVYGIVKQHDGHIEVTSELGKGTTFNLYFPAVSESEESVKKKKIKYVRRGKETILVVEDDDTVRKVAVRILKLLGYSVLTARDGKEALEVFEANLEKIRLVIMDMVMPKVGGPEVYKKLVTLKPILPVLFVTGYGYDATFEDLGTVKNKNIKLLQKPYTMESLGQKVRELLDN